MLRYELYMIGAIISGLVAMLSFYVAAWRDDDKSLDIKSELWAAVGVFFFVLTIYLIVNSL